MAQPRSGRGSGRLTPADIPRPSVGRDPGVAMRPVAEFLGETRDTRGEALGAAARREGAATEKALSDVERAFEGSVNARSRALDVAHRNDAVAANSMTAALNSFSRDMAATGEVFNALALRRQKVEDDIAIDHGNLMMTQAFDPVVEKSLTGPGATDPSYLRNLDEELTRTQQNVREQMKEKGFSLSADGERRLEHTALQLRASASRKATIAHNNQRIALDVIRGEEVFDNGEKYAYKNPDDVNGAFSRAQSTLTSLRSVLADDKWQALNERVHVNTIGAAIRGHIDSGNTKKARDLLNRYTGFSKNDASDIDKEVFNAARDKGVDPAWALAIATIESGKDGVINPTAQSETSSAYGLGQITDRTAAKLGLPEDRSQWTVPVQAKALATLTSENAAALKRGLGGADPNATDAYLAHFLGAPTAISALNAARDNPATPITDILSPAQIRANAKIEINGKPFAQANVGELYGWAQTKMGAALDAVGGKIGGRSVGSSDAIVPFRTAMMLGDVIHRAEAAGRSRLQMAITDDLKSIEITGKEVQINENSARQILTPDQFQTWQENRKLAHTFFDTTSDMAHVDNAEIARRVASLAPEPGEFGFARRETLFKAAGALAAQQYDLRESDPVAAVDTHPWVRQAVANLDPQKPDLVQVLNARLAAQEQIGIPEHKRIPISLNEIKSHINSQEPGRVGFALQTANTLLMQKPAAFAGKDGVQKLEAQVVGFRHDIEDLGMTADAAVQKFIAEQNPEYQAKVKARINGEDLNEIVKKQVSVDDARAAFKTSWIGFKPQVGFSPDERQSMYADYVQGFRDAYLENGDVGKSKAIAADRLKKTWGVTSVNGSAVVMRYAPEGSPAYAGIDDVSGRIASHAIKAIKDEAGVDVTRDQLRIAPVTGGATSSAYWQGRPPPYLLAWQDKAGVVHTLNPGRAFVADPSAMRAEIAEKRRTEFDKARTEATPRLDTLERNKLQQEASRRAMAGQDTSQEVAAARPKSEGGVPFDFQRVPADSEEARGKPGGGAELRKNVEAVINSFRQQPLWPEF